MARRKNTNRPTRSRKEAQEDETLVDIVEVKEGAQDYIEQNQTKIFGALALFVLLVGGFMAYKTLYKAPRQGKAVEQMFQAQMQFERDSFALALSNPGGGYGGFLDIIDNYGGTSAGNTAKYYAGICYLQLGKFQDAIDYLSDYSPSGDVTPMTTYGAMGDSYAELGKMDDALSYYNKAVSAGDNDVITTYYLKKVALLEQKNGNADAAKNSFQKILDNYPQSPLVAEAEKYLSTLAN